MSASLFLMCTLKINVLAYFTLRKGWRALIRKARHYIALKDRRVIWRSELTHMRANGKSERYELRVVTCRRKRTNFTPDAAKLIRIASSLLFLFSARPSQAPIFCTAEYEMQKGKGGRPETRKHLCPCQSARCTVQGTRIH